MQGMVADLRRLFQVVLLREESGQSHYTVMRVVKANDQPPKGVISYSNPMLALEIGSQKSYELKSTHPNAFTLSEFHEMETT